MDIADYIHRLDNSTAEIFQLLNTYNAAQLIHKDGDKWSIIEVLEHICITEQIVCMMLLKPSDTLADTPELLGQSKLRKLVIDLRHQQKIDAPEMLHPKGDIKNLADFERVFASQRNMLKHNLEGGVITISNKIRKHPFLGDMTITDWLNFMPLHTLRHIEQIKESMPVM